MHAFLGGEWLHAASVTIVANKFGWCKQIWMVQAAPPRFEGGALFDVHAYIAFAGVCMLHPAASLQHTSCWLSLQAMSLLPWSAHVTRCVAVRPTKAVVNLS
eukprot:GHRQ01021425.1.p2 GENE.GHRQ01021425.1~~GHRQ01021425.1.p2  ORF type:complete len:102 (-),score=10.25 GHRQ01021425.1:446-751(-)